MRRKALLIGAQTNGLTGVENDVDAIADALAKRDFEAVRREGADATRAGILAAYRELIATTRPDDAVFVYYSGHGGYIAPPKDRGVTGIDMQFIVPFDYHESTETDFRGITSVELSTLLDGLTGRTRNVVVALDCCHSAQMSRDLDLLARALPRAAGERFLASYESVSRHIVQLAEEQRWAPRGHVDAVRLVACTAQQSAYEYTNEKHQRTGMLTESLVLALQEFEGLPVDWSTVMDRIRRRVLTLVPNQRPEVEGPSGRLLFETRTADVIGAVPAVWVPGGRVRLEQAPLLGVELGDEFVVMPPGATAPDEAAMVGTATVDKLGAMVALARVRLRPGYERVPDGARAYRVGVAASTVPVRVPASDPRAAALVAAIGANPLLRLAEPGELSPARVRVDDAGFTVCDKAGPLHDPRPAGSEAEVVRNLERLARATALRTLAVDRRFALDQPVTVEWGTVDDEDVLHPLPLSGAVLHVGDKVYVRVRNDGEKLIHVSLIDIGVAGAVTLLTEFDPAGVGLVAGEEYVFGADDFEGTVTGVPVTWPEHLDPAQARLETIQVLITSAPQNVGAIRQHGVRGTAPAGGSPLDRAFAQVSMATRDVVTVGGRGVRYTLRTIEFELERSLAPPAERAVFILDERPSPQLRAMSRSARGATPAVVAVRLEELMVHRNRAWRGADIRLDAVVLTGHTDGEAVYRAQTERFSGIRDDDRLPLDRLLMYYGPAVDFLDLAIWVVRDNAGSLALSDLLQEKLTSTQFQGAGAQLLTLAGSASHAGMAMAAAGAGAIVINTAYQLLSSAVGQSIGLYRTTLLANERFGVGRHPLAGTLRAQDFSFSYTVEAVG